MSHSDQSHSALHVAWTADEQALVRAMLIWCQRQLLFGQFRDGTDSGAQAMTLKAAIEKAWPGVIW